MSNSSIVSILEDLIRSIKDSLVAGSEKYKNNSSYFKLRKKYQTFARLFKDLNPNQRKHIAEQVVDGEFSSILVINGSSLDIVEFIEMSDGNILDRMRRNYCMLLEKNNPKAMSQTDISLLKTSRITDKSGLGFNLPPDLNNIINKNVQSMKNGNIDEVKDSLLNTLDTMFGNDQMNEVAKRMFELITTEGMAKVTEGLNGNNSRLNTEDSLPEVLDSNNTDE